MGERRHGCTCALCIALTATLGQGTRRLGQLRPSVARGTTWQAPAEGWSNELLNEMIQMETGTVPWLPGSSPSGYVGWNGRCGVSSSGENRQPRGSWGFRASLSRGKKDE